MNASLTIILAFLLTFPFAKAQNLPVTFDFWENATPEEVDNHIEGPFSIRVWDGEGRNPLMLAAAANENIDVVYKVIKLSPDLNAADKNGSTALMYAAHANQSASILNVLLNNSAALNVKDKGGLTALMYSTVNPNEQITEILIKAGAALDVQDNYGLTALMHAAVNNNVKAVDMLLTAGANTNIEDVYRKTVYDYVKDGTTDESIKNMVERVKPNPLPKTNAAQQNSGYALNWGVFYASRKEANAEDYYSLSNMKSKRSAKTSQQKICQGKNCGPLKQSAHVLPKANSLRRTTPGQQSAITKTNPLPSSAITPQNPLPGAPSYRIKNSKDLNSIKKRLEEKRKANQSK